MKRIVLLFLSLFCLIISFAQNLVVNPSFEVTNTNCANFGGEGFRQDLDPSWDNANSNIPGDSCSSPDLYSACNIAFTDMPGGGLGSLGYQYSRTGTRHAGLIAYSAPFGFADNYREYIQGHTTAPLIAGQSYCVSMYVSLADGSPWAVEELGIYFSNTHYLRNACTQGSWINVVPQLENNCGVISDTANWVRLQWNYVATGGEQYFIIGNFHNDANTAEVSTGVTSLQNMFAYYYIDDVSIVANGCCYADIVNPGPLCTSDAPINLTATTGIGGVCNPSLSGTWSGPGITNGSTGQFSPSVAGVGVHTISYTLTCGYVATAQIVVGACTPLAVCQSNGNLVVSGGTGPYAWQQQTTQQDCSTCFPAIPPFIQPCSVPAGCAVNVTVWTTFATGNSIPAPATFPIRVVDTTGTIINISNLAAIPACVGCPTITVTSSNINQVSCFNGTNGSATVSASGSTTAYAYTWQPGNLTGATQNSLSAGTYTVTATDANGCTGTTTITITQPAAAISLQTSSTSADCGQNNGSATVVASGGTGAYTYSWTPSGGNGSVAQNIPAGSYTVTVQDANNCTATATVSVQNTNGPVVTLVSQENVTCNGGSNGNAVISITQGTLPYTITWSPSGGTATTASNLTAGTYVATVTDGGGCIATQNVSITEPTAIQLAFDSEPADCGFSNGSATVTATGGTGTYTYAWSPSGGSGATANGLSGGNYTVTVTDASNCTGTGSVEVLITVVDSTLSMVTTVTDETCAGNDGTASVMASNGNPPYSYLWSAGNDIDSSFTGGLSSGTYTITVSDECYSITQEVTIEKDFVVPPKAIPNIFTPNGDGTNDIYTVNDQFESVTNFSCVIYNRWGVAVYKSSDKTITWKPKNITDGTYFIVLTYTDCTGKDDKITGTITISGSKF